MHTTYLNVQQNECHNMYSLARRYSLLIIYRFSENFTKINGLWWQRHLANGDVTSNKIADNAND